MTVILANGSFPERPALLAMLREANRVVCCDGAALPLLKFGRIPDAVVGDLDSLPDPPKELDGRIFRVSEQETNDLSKAFRHCVKNGWLDITILGATGRREDHTLGNLSLLPDFARQTPDITLMSDFGVFFPMLRSGAFPTRPGEQISIFALEGGTTISSQGLKWQLADFTPTRWWQATLNEATGENVTLTFTPDKPLLIYKTFS